MKQYFLENDTEYLDILLNNKFSLIQTSATWCGPCMRVSPLVKKLVKSIHNDEWVFVYCDVDKCPGLSKQLKVKSIPCFYVYDKKACKVVDKLVSSDISAIKKLCIKHGLIEEPVLDSNTVNYTTQQTYQPPQPQQPHPQQQLQNQNYIDQHAQLKASSQQQYQYYQKQHPQYQDHNKYSGYWYNNE